MLTTTNGMINVFKRHSSMDYSCLVCFERLWTITVYSESLRLSSPQKKRFPSCSGLSETFDTALQNGCALPQHRCGWAILPCRIWRPVTRWSRDSSWIVFRFCVAISAPQVESQSTAKSMTICPIWATGIFERQETYSRFSPTSSNFEGA